MSRKSKRGMRVLALGMGLVFLMGMSGVSFATDVRIWDNTDGWVATNNNDGDPIDTGTANSAEHPQVAIDSNDRVYVTYD